ncbi:MAG: chemotaxis protein CheW [Thainema sp.]
MKSQPYLIFESTHKRYGLDAHIVEEIFLLPEITSIPEASPLILGVINLRGHILPIFDLSQRLERRLHHFAITDSIIVITNQQQRVGLVVSHVYEVEFITPQDVEFNYLLEPDHRHTALITGIAKLDSQLINLIDASMLMRWDETSISSKSAKPNTHSLPLPLKSELSSPDKLSGQSANGNQPTSAVPITATCVPPTSSDATTDYFFPTATPQQRTVLHTRAQNLLSTLEQDNSASLTPLAVIRFGEERFAIGVEAVQEFTDIRQVTPVPCCPAHVIGNMNLRGEVLTLIDIRHLLQLQGSASRSAGKAVVVKLNDLVAGIAVDEVFDVMYIHPSNISAVPTAVHTAKQDYLRGVVAYNDLFIGVLDLPEILANGELDVNEVP